MKTKCNILYILFCLTMFFSCTAEIETDLPIAGDGIEEQSNEAQVVLSMALPAQELPSTRSVSITDDSQIGADFTIWTFDGEGKDATFLSEIKSTDVDDKGNRKVVISTINGQRQMYVLLPETNKMITLCMIVNVPVVNTPTVGMKKVDALNTLEFSIGEGVDLKYMPMYGEHSLIVKQGYKASISLRRAMAKIEVDARNVYPLFKMESVELLNINLRGKVCSGIIQDQTDYPVQDITVNRAEDNIFTIYVPEIQDANGEKKVSVLLKGIYNGQPSSYYRLEFISRSQSQKVTDITRNYKYAFLIDNVTASGYSERESAISGTASNVSGTGMTLQTIKDEDIMDITTDGDYYLGVTSASILAGVNDDYYFANFSVVGNNPEGWKMITTELPVGVTVSMDSYQSDTNIEKVNSVWIYVEKSKAAVSAGNKILVYVYSGKIRKKIEVSIP